ncbi:MAG TPA: hypothetical protein VGL61_35440 [Kofleriaceae bacterium]|jgi:hypothetical protein
MTETTNPIWIAELRVILVHPNGRRVHGHIAVGQPYTLAGADPTAGYESHCPVEIDGLISRAHPIIGGGTLDALLHGIKALGMHLHAFIARGGRVLDPADDSELPLEAMFGPMLRAVELPESSD